MIRANKNYSADFFKGYKLIILIEIYIKLRKSNNLL